MDRKFFQVTRNRKFVTAVGTSGALISSGLLAWRLYNVSREQDRLQQQQQQAGPPSTQQQQHQQQSRDAPHPDLPKPQYIDLPQSVLDSIALTLDHDEVKVSPQETREDLKSLIPRHLRRPWRLVHTANTGQHEQHVVAVRELSRAAAKLADHEVGGVDRGLNIFLECEIFLDGPVSTVLLPAHGRGSGALQ